MYKPLALILCATIMLTPGTILADDTKPAATQAAPTTGLGPDSATGNNAAGGSNADGSALQGAGTSSLQTTPSDATSGSPVPAVKLFEAPTADSQNLQVMLSQEADGTPQSQKVADDATSPALDLAIAAGVLLLLLAGWFWRRPLRAVWQRLQRQPRALAEPELEAEPTMDAMIEVEPEPEQSSAQPIASSARSKKSKKDKRSKRR